MKVLIFGAAGMLGHKLYQVLSQRFDVWGTIRGGFDTVEGFGIFDPDRLIENVEVTDLVSVERAIKDIRPDVVVNAVGVINDGRGVIAWDVEDHVARTVDAAGRVAFQVARLPRRAGPRFPEERRSSDPR